jgi:hypothetical protein
MNTRARALAAHKGTAAQPPRVRVCGLVGVERTGEMFRRHVRTSVIATAFCLALASGARGAIKPETIAGLWLFDEGSGNTARDASANKADGTINGPVEWVKGRFGGALKFNGSNTSVSVTPTEKHRLKELSLTAWANIRAGARWQSILMYGQNPRNYLLVTNINTQQALLSITAGARDAWHGPSAGPVVADEKWHHLAGVIGQKEGLVLYVDGVQVGQQAYKQPSLDPDPNKIVIGDGSAGGHMLEGMLDEVALFSAPLSADDVKDAMDKGLGRFFLAVDARGSLPLRWASLKRVR